MFTMDIITNDMHQLHGANKVTENLILGKDIFEMNGINLRYVISNDGIIDCSKYESKLGAHLDKRNYIAYRNNIEYLKKTSLYRSKIVHRTILERNYNANKKAAQYFASIPEKADLIFFQDPFTAIYFLKNNIYKGKSIFISHADTDPLEQLLINRPCIRGTIIEKRLRKNYEFLFRSVDKVVTICSSSQKYMKDIYGLDCPCIINGIEDYSIKSRKFSEDDGKIHIAIVASVQYRKGQDIAVDAVGQLKDENKKSIMLHIIGDGSGMEMIKKKCDNLNINSYVVIHGAILNVRNILPKLDVFLLPSRADTVPISIIEAMRAGIPIFATGVGEIPNMIRGCGVIIDASVESVKCLFESLISNKYELDKLGENARYSFESQFRLDTMVKHYVSVIEKV